MNVNNTSSSSSINKKIDCIANLTYHEVDKLIRAHGHDSFKDLILLLIEIFESLNTSYRNEEELIEENKILIETNEKLIGQYERERYLRKDLESKLFMSEELIEDQKKDYEEKIQNLEIVATRWRRLSEDMLDMDDYDEEERIIDNDEDELLDVETNQDINETETPKISNESIVFSTADFDVAKRKSIRKPLLKSSKTFGPCSSFYHLGQLLLENDTNKSLESIKQNDIKIDKNSSDKTWVSIIDELSKERNKYKEELSELREAITFVETIRAYKSDLNGESNSQFSHNSTVVSYDSLDHDSVDSNQYLLNNSESMIEFNDEMEFINYFSKSDINNNKTYVIRQNPIKLLIRKLLPKFNGWITG